MARVPVKSIVEKKGFGLTSITMLPNLGGVKNSENGFIVYPDGSGSYYSLAKPRKQNSPIVTEIYFSNSFDLDAVDEDAKQGNYNVMIPTFGISGGKTGVAAYVTEGDTNAYLTLTPAGFSDEFNKVSAACLYRKSYSYISPSDVEINETERAISADDFAVQYFFMNSVENALTYSDMAAVIRSFVTEEKLIGSEKQNTVKANVQLIMGAKGSTGISTSLQSATTYKQAQKIVEEFSAEEKENLRLYLLGWQKGGFGFNPSGDKAASALGGAKDLKELNAWLKTQKVESYLAVNYIEALEKGIGFNKNSQAVYNEVNQPISDSDFKKYLRNPLTELSEYLDSRLPIIKDYNAGGVAFEKSGYYLYDDYQAKRKLTRSQAASTLSAFGKNTLKSSMKVAVQGGNSYMLKYTDCIYDLPETNSGNSEMTYAIPYYQMIVHGQVSYCGTVPGNMASDYEIQKLKWIETGSQPYFVLTYGSSDLLKNTYVTDAYDTDYSVWTKEVKSCIEEFNSKLSFTASSEMLSHTRLSDTLVRVVYQGGKAIYINYSDKEQSVDGITVPARNYAIGEVNAR